MNRKSHDNELEEWFRTVLRNQQAASSSECLESDRILMLVDRKVPEPESTRIMRHVALCPGCRRRYVDMLALSSVSNEVLNAESIAASMGRPKEPVSLEPSGKARSEKTPFWRGLFGGAIGFAAGAAAATTIAVAIILPATSEKRELARELSANRRQMESAHQREADLARELADTRKESEGSEASQSQLIQNLNETVNRQVQRIARLEMDSTALREIPLPAPEWLPLPADGAVRGSAAGSEKRREIRLIGPVDTAIESPRPKLEVASFPGIQRYQVTLEYADSASEPPPVHSILPRVWEPSQPLEPGRAYQWSASGELGSEIIRSRVARFYVLTAQERQQIAQLHRSGQTGLLALGALYAKLGFLDNAASAFRQILARDPDHAIAKRWLQEIRARRIR